MLTNPFYIEFKKERDLGAIISDTFKFIRENWKQYFKTVLKIIGPFLAVGAALLIFAFISYSKASATLLNGSSADNNMFFNTFGNMFIWIFVLMILWGIIYTLLAEVSLFYIKSYIQNNGIINFEEIKTNTFKNMWKFLGLGMVSIIMLLVGYVLCFLPMVYLSVVLFLAMPIMAFESKSITDTISHCFNLISGEWWNTFGVVLILGILVGVLGLAFSVPSIIYQFINTGINIQNDDPTKMLEFIDNPIYIILNVLAYFGKFLLYSVTLISSAFVYFDLNEKKNLTGTYERIDSLGNYN